MTSFINIPQTPSQVASHAKLLINAFGLQGLKARFLNIPQEATKTNNDNKYNIPQSTKDEGIGESRMLNTAIFSNLILQSFNPDGQINTTLELQTVLFSISQAKNIVTTPINGRNGTVKEYISDGDYQISIRGLLTGQNGVFPSEDYNKLISLLKVSEAIQAESWLLQRFNIYQLVVVDYNFPQEPGRYSTPIFEINAISDYPVELQINA